MNQYQEYQKAAIKMSQGEITHGEYIKECEKIRVAYQEFQFRKLLLDNGLPEEQADSISPEFKCLLLQWIEEMDELQKKVDNYASWAEDCPY